jgi:DNA-binding transcriptional LysR family regulator
MDILSVITDNSSVVDDVLAFVEVVRAGGFTAAGRQLKMSKSTLSQQVVRLEAHLGVRLLNRTTRRVALTDAGKLYYERCRGPVDAIAAASDVARESGRAPMGVLRVSVPYDLSDWLAEVLGGFQPLYPGIRVVVLLSQAREDLVAAGLDVAIRGGPRPADSALRMRVLADGYRMIFCAHPAYLAARGTPSHLGELARHDTVGFTESKLPIEGPDGVEMLHLQPKIVANEFGFLRQLLLQQRGIGLVLGAGVQGDLEEGRLVHVLPAHWMDAGAVRALFPGRRVSRKLRVFLDYLARHPPYARRRTRLDANQQKK